MASGQSTLLKRVTMIDQLYGDADTHLSYLAAHGGLFGNVA